MTITICLKLEQEKPLVLLLCVFGKFIFMNFVPMRIQRWLLIQIHLSFFFLSGFFFTDNDHWQDSKGRERNIFYSTLPLPPTYKHSYIYSATLHVWWLSHIFNCAAYIYQTPTRWDLPPYRIHAFRDSIPVCKLYTCC